jgi:hypothetical protein
MGTTSTMAIPYPESSDYVADGATAMENIATQVDDKTGLVFIKSQTIGSGVSSVTITDAFSSTFDNYKVLTNIEDSTLNSDVFFRLGGVSTYTYDRVRQLLTSASTTPSYDAATAQTAGYWGVNKAGEGSDTTAEIFRPYIAKPTTVTTSAFFKDVGGNMQFRTHASIQRDDTSFTAFTLILSSGTITGGTIRIYGYNNG